MYRLFILEKIIVLSKTIFLVILEVLVVGLCS